MDKLVVKELNTFYNGKTVLITGSTGFKGSWLALTLKSFGARVVGYALPPNSNLDLFVSANIEGVLDKCYFNDIMDYSKLQNVFIEEKPEIVFHLAAQALVLDSYEDPKTTYNTNVMGSLNVLECVRKMKGVKSLIYVTSDKAYANNEWIWGYRENDRLGGHDPYSSSKAAAEILFSSYSNSFFKNKSVGLCSVRAGNVIGGGDFSKDRIVPDCVKSFWSNKPVELRMPKATRPWQHVLEPLGGYILLGMRAYNEPSRFNGSWNFGPNVNSVRSVQELTEAIGSYFEYREIYIYDSNSNKHEAGLLHLNCDKANQRLGWSPLWDFEKTIERTCKWYTSTKLGLLDTQKITLEDINNYFQI